MLGRWSGSSGAAVIIGAATGLAAVAFRYLILGVTFAVTGTTTYGVAGRTASTHLPALGPWFLVLAPIAGGLLYGPLVYRLAPETRGTGVSEVMAAVARDSGRIRGRVAVVKAVASGVCIGTGGSVGQWGPVVQIGSALGSAIARSLRMSDHRMRMLVTAGAAGGISALFDAPVAGVIFGLEVILRRFSVGAFGLTAIASVTATVVARPFLGSGPFLPVPVVGPGSAVELPLYGVLGVCAGAVGWVFVRTLYRTQDVCDRMWRGPDWLRPAAGGVALGVLLLALPPLYGLGFGALQQGIVGGYTLAFLLALLVGKILATSVTIGIGGSGGVVAPSLFIGGMLGTAFGTVAQPAFPGLGLSPEVFGIVGMAGVLAAASHTPIVALVAAFELTGQYAIALPLLVTVLLATGVSRLISRENIYTLPLLRRGIDLDAAAATDGRAGGTPQR